MWLVVSIVAQFVLIGVLAVIVLSLARQIGILHERTAPASLVRGNEAVVGIGDELPDLELNAVSGAVCRLAAEGSDAATALLFVAPDCPICKSVLPAFAQALDRQAGCVGYWVGDGMDPGAFSEYAQEHGLDGDRVLLSQELGLRLGVRTLPVLTLLDAERRVLAQETITGPRRLENLFAAHLSGEDGQQAAS